MFYYENKLFGSENSYSADCLKNFNFNSHFHRSYEIIYVIEGKMELKIDEKTYVAEKGDMVCVFPNQLHSLKTIEFSRINLIIFSPELVGRFASDYHNLVPKNNMIHNAQLEKEDIYTKNIYKQKSILYSILATYTESTGFEQAAISGDFKLIHRILTFIEENISGKCTLKEAAKVLKYDYAYLSKQFVKIMNMSYTEYLNRYRINQACYMINNNHSIVIGDLYMKCGFDSARSFNRNFKKYVGMTPSEFKNRTKAGN